MTLEESLESEIKLNDYETEKFQIESKRSRSVIYKGADNIVHSLDSKSFEKLLFDFAGNKTDKIENLSVYNLEAAGHIIANTKFEFCRFDDCSFQNIQFINCEFNHCTFNKNLIYNVLFKECDFQETKFIKSRAHHTSFYECVIEDCSFNFGNIDSVSFPLCNVNKLILPDNGLGVDYYKFLSLSFRHEVDEHFLSTLSSYFLNTLGYQDAHSLEHLYPLIVSKEIKNMPMYKSPETKHLEFQDNVTIKQVCDAIFHYCKISFKSTR